MEPGLFGVYTAVGAAPFTLALLYAGYVLGQHWAEIQGTFRILDYVAAALIGVFVVYVLLRWRHVIDSGFPPKLIRSIGSPRPAEDAPP